MYSGIVLKKTTLPTPDDAAVKSLYSIVWAFLYKVMAFAPALSGIKYVLLFKCVKDLANLERGLLFSAYCKFYIYCKYKV